METIDIKSMIIGVLLATTIVFGMGAAKDKPQTDEEAARLHLRKLGIKLDESTQGQAEPQWLVASQSDLAEAGLLSRHNLTAQVPGDKLALKVKGWEPFACYGANSLGPLWGYRKRIK